MEKVNGALRVIFVERLPIKMMVGDIGVNEVGIGVIASGDQDIMREKGEFVDTVNGNMAHVSLKFSITGFFIGHFPAGALSVLNFFVLAHYGQTGKIWRGEAEEIGVQSGVGDAADDEQEDENNKIELNGKPEEQAKDKVEKIKEARTELLL